MDITTYLNNLCLHCGLQPEDCTVTVDETDQGIDVQLDVSEDNIGLFIGHRGETLAAIQRLTRVTFHEEYPDTRITLNINDYREERLQQLKDRTLEQAQQVLETGRPYRFPFLSSYERYVVHSTIGEDETLSAELETTSTGEGRARRLVIRVKSDSTDVAPADASEIEAEVSTPSATDEE